MTPEKSVQSSGGTARDRRLSDWEKAFVAMLGGSKRPITKDRRASAEQVASELKQEGVKTPIPWKGFFAVGMNGALVSSALSRPALVEKIRQIGDIAGLVGVIFFNKAWRTYTRRFFLDPLAQKRLDALSAFFTDHFRNFQAEELKRRAKDADESLLSAQVYVDPSGETVSMFYSFDSGHLPQAGSKRVGTVYLVNKEKAQGHYDPQDGPWLTRWHSERPHSAEYARILQDAKNRFDEVVAKLHQIQVVEVDQR
jgi:hypothetical protein